MNIVHRDEVAPFRIDRVEGKPLPGGVHIRKMLHGVHGLLLEVHVPKGSVTPSHKHEHDSFIYVLSGSVRATVGDEVGVVGAGDAVLHPAGVMHVSEALEDSVWLEVKAPAEITW